MARLKVREQPEASAHRLMRGEAREESLKTPSFSHSLSLDFVCGYKWRVGAAAVLSKKNSGGGAGLCVSYVRAGGPPRRADEISDEVNCVREHDGGVECVAYLNFMLKCLLFAVGKLQGVEVLFLLGPCNYVLCTITRFLLTLMPIG